MLSAAVFLPDVDPADLAADGFREFIHEFDDTRVFVGSRHALHMVLQFLDKIRSGLCPVFRRQNDGGLDHLSPDFVRDTGNGAFHYGRVCH